ncbi:hypothetical protein DPSP01_000185 [Paraphaeosphaeria sporulosa]
MAPAILASFLAQLEQKPEFKIIHTLLLDPDADPSAVAEKIVELTIPYFSRPNSASMWEDDEPHLFHTACSVIEVAQRTPPERQDKLCDFVMALKQHSLNDTKTGKPLMDGGAKVWTDLPAFGYTFADCTQFMSGYDKKTSEEAQQDENLEAFLAKLTGDPRDRTVDLSDRGQLAMSRAFYLETAQIPPGRAVHTIRLGCWWFIRAAAALWANVQDPKNDNWSLELWNFYKEGLLTRKAEIRNHEVRKMIEQAIEEMEKAERGNSQ